MSKDFEQAYKELAQSEIPDLWDRIEAGISEKSTPEKIEKIPSEKKKKIYFRRYTGMAAAVLCVALIVPAAFFLGQQGRKSSNLEMAAGQSSENGSDELTECVPEDVPETGPETGPEAAPEVVEGAEVDRAPSGATAGGAEIITEAAADAGEDMAAEESVPGIMEDKEKEMENADQSAATESLSAPKVRGMADLEDGTVIEKVRVDVIEAALLDDNEDLQSMGTVYTAVVLKDESGCFEEGEQIVILVPIHSSVVLTEGRAFEVDLIYREEEEYPFTLKVIR